MARQPREGHRVGSGSRSPPVGHRDAVRTSTEVRSASTSFPERSQFPPASRARCGAGTAWHGTALLSLGGSPIPAGRREQPRVPRSGIVPRAAPVCDHTAPGLSCALGDSRRAGRMLGNSGHHHPSATGAKEHWGLGWGCPPPCSPWGFSHIFGWVIPAPFLVSARPLWQGLCWWQQQGPGSVMAAGPSWGHGDPAR